MGIYHEVWLAAHPDRTAEWLADRLRDGFHIHHIDGDWENNSPDNLALMEGLDHIRLHSAAAVMRRGKVSKPSGDRWKRPPRRCVSVPDPDYVSPKRMARMARLAAGKIVGNKITGRNQI